VNPLAIEAEARRIWEVRELTFPHFTRMRWEDGTWLARLTTYAEARRQLEHCMPEIPTPYVDTDAALNQPDSEALAQLYEARAGAMEQQAADARSPQQAEGLRLGAGSFRRKAEAIRKRLEATEK